MESFLEIMIILLALVWSFSKINGGGVSDGKWRIFEILIYRIINYSVKNNHCNLFLSILEYRMNVSYVN